MPQYEDVYEPPVLDTTGQNMLTQLTAMVTKLQGIIDGLSPTAAGVSVSNTGMHIVTEDDVQGAISELDSAVDSVNASLMNKTANVPINEGCVLNLIRSGNVVTASIQSGSLTNAYTTGGVLCTLPSGFRPSFNINVVITNLTNVRLTFNSTGTLVTNNAISSGASPRLAVTYITSDDQPT